MPLTRSQVRAAFTAARKHYGGKIPKGTKLARFVPGHHKTSHSSRPTHHSSSPARRSVTPSRRSRAKAAVSRHPKLVTRGINGLGLLIAFGDSAAAALRVAEGQALPSNLPRDIVYAESGYDLNTGQLNLQQTTKSITLKGVAWGVTKVAKHFTKSFRM